jgi:hypothetical protein
MGVPPLVANCCGDREGECYQELSGVTASPLTQSPDTPERTHDRPRAGDATILEAAPRQSRRDRIFVALFNGYVTDSGYDWDMSDRRKTPLVHDLGAAALGAVVLGVIAIGAFAIARLASARLAIARMNADDFRIRDFSIENLDARRLKPPRGEDEYNPWEVA